MRLPAFLRRLICRHRSETYSGLIQLPDGFHITTMCDCCKCVSVGRGVIRQPVTYDTWQRAAEGVAEI